MPVPIVPHFQHVEVRRHQDHAEEERDDCPFLSGVLER